MKFFTIFFVILICICCFFGFTGKDSGYLFGCAGLLAVILGCVLLFNTLFRGGPFSDRSEAPKNKLNSFALPVLLLLGMPAQQIFFLCVLIVALLLFSSLRFVKRIR
jgi:hypothetical protein